MDMNERLNKDITIGADIYTVYVLYSSDYDKIYIGYTTNLLARFHSHNSLSPKGWTKRYRPWEVCYCEYYDNKSAALQRERELKSSRGRSFIRTYISEDMQ